MKFTIATIHPAYAFPFSPDGKDVATELSQGNGKYSVADLNWLKPSEDYNYNSELLLNEGIEGLNNVDTSLTFYFKEQFLENESRLLWMPSFYINYLHYKNHMQKSIFESDNLLSELVRKEVITDLEVIVFHLGKQSLDNLSYSAPKSVNEKLSEKIKVTDYEVLKNSIIFDALQKSYSLSVYFAEDSHQDNWRYLHESSDVAFSKYGNLLDPLDKTA